MTRPAENAPLSVLYVDDDSGLTRLVEKYLRRKGYRVATASDVAGGFAKLQAEAFDVVAVDHFMPGEDGIELLRCMRDLPQAPPAIYVTSAQEGRVAVSALKLGAIDYVLKDVDGAFLDLLDQAILQAVETSRTRAAKQAAEDELRVSRDRLAELLEQKTALLHEVTHRVANSLQLIASLINIQAAKISDPRAREALLQARERVQAVMLVHRRLYTSDEVGLVQIDKYLEALAEELQVGVGAEQRHRIAVSAEPLKIAPDKAVSLGVIVNELVTNALKYAFPPGAAGDVRIALGREAEERVRLTVEDNGIGHSGNEAPKGTGLGTLIIGAMAKTLKGAVERAPSPVGSRITLSFPLR